MKAIVLAAGYATRLYPLTENAPKCLLKVGERTILDSIFLKITQLHEVDEIVLVTNAKFYDQLRNWSEKGRWRIPVRLLNDGTMSNETRIGAIGDLGLAVREAKIDDEILLFASDNLFDQDLSGFADFVASKKEAVCIAVYELGDPSQAAGKYGIIEVDSSGSLIGMEEKPARPKSSLIGVGVYYFPKSSLGLLREYLADKDRQDAPGHYILWLFNRGVRIFCFPFKGMWYDIGDLRALEEAQKTFESKI